MGILRDERTAAEQGTGAFALRDAMHHQAEEDHHDGDLDDHDAGVQVGHQVDATQVEQGHHGDQCHNEDPRRDAGEDRFQVNFGQQNVDHRHKQIIKQRGPAHHEADVRADRLLRVGVGGAGGREAFNQLSVTDRRKQDGNQRNSVGGGNVTIGQSTDDAEGIEDRHRLQVCQAHHDDLNQGQGLA